MQLTTEASHAEATISVVVFDLKTLRSHSWSRKLQINERCVR